VKLESGGLSHAYGEPREQGWEQYIT